LPNAQPVVLEVLRRVRVLRGLEERLRRDASPVEAHAAELLLLDTNCLLPQVLRADRGDIPAWTRADHAHVVASHGAPYTTGWLREAARVRLEVRSPPCP